MMGYRAYGIISHQRAVNKDEMLHFKRFFQKIDLSWLRSLSYLWFVPPALVIGGLQGLYTAALYPEPMTYTVDEYARTSPPDKWLILTNAQLDWDSVTYVKVPLIGLVTDAYVPVFARDNSDGNCGLSESYTCPLRPTQSSLSLFVTTTNRQMIQQIQAIQLQNASPPIVHETPDTVVGMAKFGIEGLTSDRRRWLKDKYGDRLTDDVIVIDLNARPNVGRSVAFFIGGVAVGIWLLQPRLCRP